MTNKITTYQFDIEDAVKYGVDEAIFLYNLKFWLTKNLANNKHIYDGEVWTYNTSKAYNLLFPFWSPDKIKRLLISMEKRGIIISGEYNKTKYDRTKWYSIRDFCTIERAILHNGAEISAPPIPDINTDNKTDENIAPVVIPSLGKSSTIKNMDTTAGYSKLRDIPRFNELWEVFLKQRKPKSNTPYALKLVCEKLCYESSTNIIKMLENAIENGWQTVYPLKVETIYRSQVSEDYSWMLENYENIYRDETSPEIAAKYKKQCEDYILKQTGKKLIW